MSQTSALLEEARRRIAEMPRNRPLRIMTATELMAMEFPPRFFEHDAELDVMRVYWGGYDYEVDLDRIETPLDVIRSLHHLSGKNWPLMTTSQLGALGRKLCEVKGWPLFPEDAA